MKLRKLLGDCSSKEGEGGIKIIMSNTKSRYDSSKNIMHFVADQFNSMKSSS
jgi:hypothetical protein